jgi:hypothetical protein|tara:strand:+ start:3592 stop:3795 length:204 start_codon:yes stop_codon:yes gene_type:complete
MTNNETIQLKILEAKTFLKGQLQLYKIEFVNTEDNKYLDTMNQINKTINLIDYLEKNSIEIAKKNKI